jgi:hypothetical protein
MDWLRARSTGRTAARAAEWSARRTESRSCYLELPLLYREEANELLKQATGETFGYDCGVAPTDNAQAIARICDHVRALKLGEATVQVLGILCGIHAVQADDPPRHHGSCLDLQYQGSPADVEDWRDASFTDGECEPVSRGACSSRAHLGRGPNAAVALGRPPPCDPCPSSPSHRCDGSGPGWAASSCATVLGGQLQSAALHLAKQGALVHSELAGRGQAAVLVVLQRFADRLRFQHLDHTLHRPLVG